MLKDIVNILGQRDFAFKTNTTQLNQCQYTPTFNSFYNK